MIAVWTRRQEIEFQKARAQLQALLSQQGASSEAILSAFEDLKQAFFPYLDNEKEEVSKRMRSTLDREVARGAVVVEPKVDLFRHKIASKLVRGEAALAARQEMVRAGQLSQLDQFTKARRRTRAAS